MTATDAASGDSPKAHYGKVADKTRLTADEMDLRRQENIAYEYLCHLEEAKVWIEACVCETLPQTTELEEGLRNGVFLAKLAHFMSPETVPLKRIYDREQTRFQARGLHFRHTDNINHWLRAMEELGLPKIFYPETTDIYDRKNMPRTIYCLHALSLFLFKLGKAPQIQDLYGKIKFTDEEISAMAKELEKYGIQMPAFSKIGGILANEMPVDEAALHAAIIAINEAIDHQVASETLTQLQNPAAHLVAIFDNLADFYQPTLFEAKHVKAENARNKSLDPESSYIPDVYDELLTQAELQGYINKVNTTYALGMVNSALENGNAEQLLKCLMMPHLNLREIQPQNAEFYLARARQMHEYKKNNNSGDGTLLSKEELQTAVALANQDADEDFQKLDAVRQFNEALNGDDPEATVKILQNPRAVFPTVEHEAAILYHEEFRNIRTEKQALLDHEEIVGGVQVLTSIAHINKAVDTGNSGLTFSALSNVDAHVANLDHGCQEKYHQTLAAMMKAKKRERLKLLTHFDIQSCVNGVNQQVSDENNRIMAVGLINEAVEQSDASNTLKSLQLPTAKLQNVTPENQSHYQALLHRCKQEKAKEMSDPSAVLWYEEIQGTIELANRHLEEAKTMSTGVRDANSAITAGDLEKLVSSLTAKELSLRSVTPDCAKAYLGKLQDMLEQKKKAGEVGSGWMMNRTREGYKFYYNIENEAWAWERPDGVRKDHSLLTREEIQSCITDVTAAYDRHLLYKANEDRIVNMQARTRGFLARKRYSERLSFINTQLPAIITIQSWWRMIVARRRYLNRMQHFHNVTDQVIKLQSCVRMFLLRKRYLERVNYLKKNEAAVVKLQAFMRSNWAKHDYKTLMYGDNPPLSVVRKFVHLLDIGDADYTEEIEIEKLRQQVVSEIRNNAKLENDLNQMDIKIGLLVKNRITLQDVMTQHRSLKQYREYSSSTLPRGLKALSKASRERLEGYQHLFYLLQTQPSYLARLIFEMPQIKTTKFMESVILTLYNYASNTREEFLLLKLFKTALQEEIRDEPSFIADCLESMKNDFSKVEKIGDIVTGNPLVVKMIVSFNRNARGQGALRELLNPLVTEVLEDRNMAINTNPVEVYKQWINQKESQTGKAREELPSVTESLDESNEDDLDEPSAASDSECLDDSMDSLDSLDNDLDEPLITADCPENVENDPEEPLAEAGCPESTENDVEEPSVTAECPESTENDSGLPYDVTLEQALAVEEVRERIEQSVQCLQAATDKFLIAILAAIENIPYGMRYMAKVLRDALHEKFPDALEKDVLKIVGNLIYYRYINSTIVAPDAFDIVDISTYKGLSNDQRRNLGSIAKILQFAASNKGFGGDSAHLSSLNPYIMESHNKFKKYFRAICDVPEPENKFNMDQYSDVTKITKPVIYITIAEIIETHKLLLEHQDALAPEPMDALHELLEDLGDVPDLESLIGEAGGDDSAPTKHQMGKTEISLALSNKFEVPEDDKSDMIALMLRTKRMVVDVIRCQSRGENLVEVLNTPASEVEELDHQALVAKRDRIDQRVANRRSKLVRQQSLLGDNRLPLETMKIKIKGNLTHLEKGGLVSSKDNYQDLIRSIVQDIRSQRVYRQRRKQEMVRVKATLKSLSQKRTFYVDQIDYYNQYVKTCLDNLTTKGKKSGKRVSLFHRDGGPTAKGSIKYSAAKLYDKGVILEIEGLPWNQFKNVLFEITATESPGHFEVNAKFMGVNMEKVNLVFQDLLQLQYEGVAVMKMFDKARVNVNLLIFLLNKKFYGK